MKPLDKAEELLDEAVKDSQASTISQLFTAKAKDQQIYLVSILQAINTVEARLKAIIYNERNPD